MAEIKDKYRVLTQPLSDFYTDEKVREQVEGFVDSGMDDYDHCETNQSERDYFSWHKEGFGTELLVVDLILCALEELVFEGHRFSQTRTNMSAFRDQFNPYNQALAEVNDFLSNPEEFSIHGVLGDIRAEVLQALREANSSYDQDQQSAIDQYKKARWKYCFDILNRCAHSMGHSFRDQTLQTKYPEFKGVLSFKELFSLWHSGSGGKCRAQEKVEALSVEMIYQNNKSAYIYRALFSNALSLIEDVRRAPDCNDILNLDNPQEPMP